MAQAVLGLVESYKEVYGLSRQEAVAKVNEPAWPEDDDKVLRGPPDEVSWAGLHNLIGRDPDRALARWEEVKQAARDEVRSGHRGAKVVERSGGTPWQMAQFLALRQDLLDGWQPRDGIERQLLETMAQAQTAVEYWLRVLMSRAALEQAPPEGGGGGSRRG
jgi:hypothetical protein